MSQEQLEELELEIRLKEEEEQPDMFYSQYISILDEMHKRLRVDRTRREEADYIKKRIVSNLIRYGTYLKTILKKDENVAVHSLERALRYDSGNPIANYRLAFLSYKNRDYEKAIPYFNTALHQKVAYEKKEYSLNEQQLYYANLYLTNSCLHLATQTQELLEKSTIQVNKKPLPDLEMSTMYRLIEENDTYLQQNAFYKIEGLHVSTCSKSDCEEIASSGSADKLILFFNDRENEVLFGEKGTLLNENNAIMLCQFLLNSSKKNPLTRSAFLEVFDHTEVMKKNTFIKRVGRLKEKLSESNFPEIIETTSLHGEPAYYFNEAVDPIVMYRVDDNISEQFHKPSR